MVQAKFPVMRRMDQVWVNIIQSEQCQACFEGIDRFGLVLRLFAPLRKARPKASKKMLSGWRSELMNMSKRTQGCVCSTVCLVGKMSTASLSLSVTADLRRPGLMTWPSKSLTLCNGKAERLQWVESSRFHTWLCRWRNFSYQVRKEVGRRYFDIHTGQSQLFREKPLQLLCKIR